MSRILSYGSLNLDYVYHVPHFVAPGETLASCSRDVNCGGKGLNQSIASARAGATVCHAGKIGPDGQLLADTLASSGVDSQGQNCILLYGGSNQKITHQEVELALEGFGPGDYLIVQNEINCLDYIMEQGAKKGLSIVFNPSPIDEHISTLPLHLVSLLVFNEIEGAALAGTSEEGQILDILRSRWPSCQLLLTLGSRGCIYDDGTQRITQGVYRTKAVDTTAAGDTFTGYFVACLAAGMDAPSCLNLASRAAAIAVSRPGAAPSIPTMDEVRGSTLSLA